MRLICHFVYLTLIYEYRKEIGHRGHDDDDDGSNNEEISKPTQTERQQE